MMSGIAKGDNRSRKRPSASRERARQSRPAFYSRALDEAEQLELEEATELSGLDDEIAVLRVMLKRLIEEYPDEIKLQMEAANTVARLVRTRYQITKEQKKSLKEAIQNVLTEIAVPLGIKVLGG